MFRCENSDTIHNTFFEKILCPICIMQSNQTPFSGTEKRSKEEFIKEMKEQGITYESLQKEKQNSWFSTIYSFFF